MHAIHILHNLHVHSNSPYLSLFTFFFDLTPCKSSTSRASLQETLGGTGDIECHAPPGCASSEQGHGRHLSAMSHSTPRKTRRPDEALVSYPALRPEGCLTCIRDDMTSPARMYLHFNFFQHILLLFHSCFAIDINYDTMTQPDIERVTVAAASHRGTATNSGDLMRSSLDCRRRGHGSTDKRQ